MKNKTKYPLNIGLLLLFWLLGLGSQFILPSSGIIKLAKVPQVHQLMKTKTKPAKTSTASSSSAVSTQPSTKSQTSASALPKSHQSDWDLLLVNRSFPSAELNPKLADVSGVQVDARIKNQTAAFLAAAKKIDPEEHLISGYRSVAYQTKLFNDYVDEEMKGEGTVNRDGKRISKAQATANVRTYSQPPEMSEHQTGLAIDMSTVDSLDASNPAVVAKVAALAPQYGFVLRFLKGKAPITGVDYEDWHYRYVGVANAQYMTQHHLVLEEYLSLLPK